MRIGINARYLQNPHSGIETYIHNLILCCKKLDTKNNYTLFFANNKDIPETVSGAEFERDIFKMPISNQPLKVLWEHLYLPFAIKKNNIDVFHESSFVAPMQKRCPVVITIYDLAFLRVPFLFSQIVKFCPLRW